VVHGGIPFHKKGIAFMYAAPATKVAEHLHIAYDTLSFSARMARSIAAIVLRDDNIVEWLHYHTACALIQ
jgi:hypothetical protein